MTEKSWAEENLPAPATLEEAIRQRNFWVDTAAQHCRNEEYYRGLVVKIGEKLGPDVYVSDDGSVQQDVLCAKVPEIIERLNLDVRCERGCTLKKINGGLREAKGA